MMTEDEADKLVQTMFDEVTEVKMVNGKPMISDAETIAQMDAEELQNAINDIVRSFNDFNQIMSRGVDPLDPQSIGWWRATEYLMLANNRLKDIFCDRDRSPASIKHYSEFRSSVRKGSSFKANA